MKNRVLIFISSFLLFGACETPTPLQQHGQHYQQHQDSKSLSKVIELLPDDADTTLVKKLLGEPIDMGFDYRYLLDSLGEKGCVVGGVFHINEHGKIDQKWLGEICE